MEEHKAITKMLLDDCSLALYLYHHSQNGGIENGRYAAILEPNPDEGKLAGDGDQQYRLGPQRIKRGYGFVGHDTQEVLGLLERFCSGDTRVESTLQSSLSAGGHSKGHYDPQGGLDTWIFHGFSAYIQKQVSRLCVKVSCRDFHAAQELVVSNKEADSVGEGISDYEAHLQDPLTPWHIYRGALFQDNIMGREIALERGKLKLPKCEIADCVREEFSRHSRVMVDYSAAIQALEPLNVSLQAKNALFVSLAVRELFPGSKRQDV